MKKQSVIIVHLTHKTAVEKLFVFIETQKEHRYKGKISKTQVRKNMSVQQNKTSSKTEKINH